jgi:multiple sugar transport system substrate-binding protein
VNRTPEAGRGLGGKEEKMEGARAQIDLGGVNVSRREFLRKAGRAGLALGAAGTLGSLAACGGGGSGSNEITLVHPGTAETSKTWEALFDVFRKDHPDIKLNARSIAMSSWSDFFDTVSVQIAGGKVPDVIQVATEGQRLFASRGLVEPLNEYIERDRKELQDYFDDVHPKLVEWTRNLTSPGEETYYLPGGFNTMCMWYSAELFQQAGVDEPTDDWSWEDFLAAAEAVTEPGKTFGMYVEPAYFASVMPWLLTNDASTMNADWTKSTVASPDAVEAAEFMRSLVERGISPKPGGEFDAFTAMSQGKLAMFGGGRWPVISMRNLDYIDKVKLVAWPQKERKGSPIGWDSYPIMKESQSKDAAWEFVKFMTSKKASEFFAEQGGTIVPPRRSVAQSDAFLSNAPEGTIKLYEAVEYATPIPSPDKGSVIEQEIIDTFTQILAGNAEPREALEKLDQTIQSNLQ